jgi:two-component system, NarL family, response regulator YdfI
LIRVLIVAPALAVRAGLRALLIEDSEIEIAGEASSLLHERDVQAHHSETIDVWVIVDAAFPAVESAAFASLESLLLDAEPPGLLLLIEDSADLARLLPGMNTRAWGVLPLDSSAEELQSAVRALNHGLLVGAADLLEQILAAPAQNGELLAQTLAEALTERELQVLSLLAQGLANKQIAVQLGISEHTVKFHVSSIYAKLGVNSRTEAVRQGVRQGLIVL